MKKLAILLAAMLIASGSVHSANYCGELKNHYGPLDYRKRGKVNLEIVETHHFSQEVEAGVKGQSGYLGGDLDYTLRAIPNHSRALATLARVAVRDKQVIVPYTKWPVECYFERARRFAPDDPAPVAVLGNYLFSIGKFDKALEAFKQATELAPEDPTINYNLGLLYMKTKDHDKALVHAQKAYAKEFPLPGLKNKLIEAGKWTETAPTEQVPTEQAPAEQAQ